MRTESPRNAAECAEVIRVAITRKERIAFAGTGSWIRPQADMTVNSNSLNRTPEIDSDNMVATVDAGRSWNELQKNLRSLSRMVAADVPGTDRTIGSVISTGTTGPLRTGFGRIRDQILGLTFVNGGGKIVTVGGRVVKNVAGFDLARMVCGSFGAFGMLTTVNLKIRPLAESDVTLQIPASFSELCEFLGGLRGTDLQPAAMELECPTGKSADDASLLVRLIGSNAATESDARRVRELCGSRVQQIESHTSPWNEVNTSRGRGDVLLSLGTTAGDRTHVFDILRPLPGTLSISAGLGSTWSGDATVESLGDLLGRFENLNIPVTLERAEPALLSRFGHFPNISPSVRTLVSRITEQHDPMGIITHGAEYR